MIKHIFVTVVLGVAATAYPMQSLAAGQDWYPKATDTCATLLTEIPRFGGSKPLNPAIVWHDPAMSKTVSELNAALGIEDSSGGYALVSLINYCISHGLTKLGDIKTDDVLKEPLSEPIKKLGVDVSAGAPSPSNPEQRELADQWTRWLKQSLDWCGADERCQELANRTFANNLRCTEGDRLACDNTRRDVAEWKQFNTQRTNPAPQTTPQNAMMQCLQDTAAKTAKWCSDTNCDRRYLVQTIGIFQRARCGYSAIEPIQPPAARTPQTDYLCVDAMTSGGGVSWGMAMQTCTR